MKDIVIPILSLLLGGVLGGFVQAVYNYKKEILSNIWIKRFEEYKKIWEITGVLPKYPEDRDKSYQDLYNTCLQLKDWYFKNGGIILSKKSRVAYENLQRLLYSVSYRQTNEIITPKDYNSLQQIFSAFRAELTNDLTSRNRSFI